MNESFSFKGYRAATHERPYWPKARQRDSETMNNLMFEGEPVSGLCSNNWKERQLKNESRLESLFNVLASRSLKTTSVTKTTGAALTLELPLRPFKVIFNKKLSYSF